jgi:YD repeat-containing protein
MTALTFDHQSQTSGRHYRLTPVLNAQNATIRYYCFSDHISISVTVPDDLVERYDFDNDGNISIDELGQAGTDFASGKSVS